MGEAELGWVESSRTLSVSAAPTSGIVHILRTRTNMHPHRWLHSETQSKENNRCTQTRETVMTFTNTFTSVFGTI